MPPGRATDQRATAPAQRATTWGDPAGVDLGGTWDKQGNYWYTDENTGANWVWQEPQKQWTELSTPADAIRVQGRAPSPAGGVTPYQAWVSGIGTRWGQRHGVILGIGAAPIAEPMAFAAEKGSVVVGSLVPGGQGFLLAGPPLARARKEMTDIRERWAAEAKERDREWDILQAEGRGDLYRVPVVIGATAPKGAQGTPARVQQLVDRIADTYRAEIAKAKARLPNASASEIGRVAEQATLDQVEPLARAVGLDPGHIWIGDFPVGVTGPKGGASTAEMGSPEYGFIIELKKSPRALRGYQTDSHRVAVEEAVNFENSGNYYRIYGENYEGEGVETQKIGEPQVEAEPTIEAVP